MLGGKISFGKGGRGENTNYLENVHTPEKCSNYGSVAPHIRALLFAPVDCTSGVVSTSCTDLLLNLT